MNMGTLMSTFDVGIVNIAMPTMAEQFSSALAQIQWNATVYLLGVILLL
ncbi:hypothetical protein O9H85_04325 [Paenibacillus filicis]|uniref:Major facilitator superfamily (MFS) profile domain-containing protein n=1 Tax=Paenibacillus gyeongsangnamensis TaxID=3388067 RepID=A0ABT4Q466_9BACL|nr:hypothetical protein [Paenibacillus filicis]MCZ8511669.1 hypothetical protein [Paenibacillus filicis]